LLAIRFVLRRSALSGELAMLVALLLCRRPLATTTLRFFGWGSIHDFSSICVRPSGPLRSGDKGSECRRDNAGLKTT
jgi:hypothetical protein